MTSELHPGEAFGEYILERRLGAGGFGDVWLARDSGGSPVAVKIMHGKYASGQTAKLRAEIELLAATASSRSSHIAQVLGGGADPEPHVVMEYIEGTDLSQEIDRRGTLPVAEVVDVAEGVSDALVTLQRAGIIHRDIKPGNVMIDRQGVVKLTDFGIAKIIGIDTVTATGQASMSMPYAAPEVWEGKASHLSDHYAFGVLLYQCLTGRVPFGGSYAEIYHQHIAVAPDLDSLPAETPPSLRKLISNCLEKDPAQRPQNARALQTAAAAAKAELGSPSGSTQVRPLLQEPKQIGPWVIESRHADDPWVFTCRHETTGEEADVEVHFTDDLNEGAQLRQQYPGRSSRLILRPGEGWNGSPETEFLFWVARSEDTPTTIAPAPQPDSQSIHTSIAPVATGMTGAAAAAASNPPPARRAAAPPPSSPPPVAPPPSVAASGGGGGKSGSNMPMMAAAAVVAVVVVLGLAFALGLFGSKSKKENTAAKAEATAIASQIGQTQPTQPTPAAAQPTAAITSSAGAPAAPTAATSASTPPAAGPPGTITIDGPAVTANTTAAGQKARFTFTGAAGQTVSVLVTKVSKPLATSCAYVIIYDAAATTTALGRTLVCSETEFLDQVDLAAAGTYTLSWEPLDQGMGQATFNLYNVKDVTGDATVNGAPLSFSSTVPGQNAHYTFTGAGGQVVSVLVSNVSKPLGVACAYVSIVDSLAASQGQTLICSDGGFLDQVSLPTNGTYTLVLNPLGSSVGQATLTLFNVVDVTGTIVVDGPPVLLSTTTPGQNARYTFDGKAGQSVSVAVTKVSKPLAAACSYVSILDAIGTSLGKSLVCSDETTPKVDLPSAGKYTMTYDPLEAGIGQATLNLITPK